MPPQIHIFDLLAIVGLTWLALWGWRGWSRRRAPDKAAPGRWRMVVSAAVILFLVAHMWAFIRPIEVFVVTMRYMRADERAWLSKLADNGQPGGHELIASMLRAPLTSEHVSLSVSSSKHVTSVDIWRIKASLAWGSWLPRMPKILEVRDSIGVQPFPDGLVGVTGYYNWRQLRQKEINYHNRHGGWTTGGIRERSGCGEESTNVLTKFLDYSPIDFRSYDQTF